MIIKNGNTIHLQGRDISYIMHITDEGDLLNLHFGRKLEDFDYSSMTDEWREGLGFATNAFPLDVYPQEYPAYGYTDLREPAYRITNKYGDSVSRARFVKCEIHEGAMGTADMPCLFGKEARTLEITLQDDISELEIRLYYVVFDEYNIIARHAVIVNKSDADAELTCAYSASVDLPMGDYKMVHFAGTWGREREMFSTPLPQGLNVEAENARGGSGHQVNPFAMIADAGADETHGNVYAFSLIYSGNHSTAAKVDQFGILRVRQGINPRGFSWTLKPNDSFCTPQSVICFSQNGYGDISREYHKLYVNHLMRSKWARKDRPVLINNWEGTYFDFTEEKLLNIARKAAEAGIELFVLDDGWFGSRNDDKSSLGDWFVNKNKLPSGIDGLAKKVNTLGLKFGLWIEPEMISPNSDLYRAHPGWAVKTARREPVEIRNQLILDLSRSDVCDYVINTISKMLSEANIEYIKWDMNRQMTDMPYEGFNHAYTLGLYKVMSTITQSFPNVLFEGCSAGGGRFDPGILAYMPQIWASDNSDAVARLKIQYSTSMCYPVSSISAHVTASPNHQCGRITTLETRAGAAYAGAFGYELDITKMTDTEFEEVKRQVEFVKNIRSFIRTGDLYRLQNPYESNYCGWEVVSEDKSRAFVFTCKILAVAQSKNPWLKLFGLDEKARYRSVETGEIYGGDMLMYRGIRINYDMRDFAARVIVFEKI